MAYAWAISIRPFSLLLFTLLFLDQFNPSMQREESQAIAVEVIDYLLHHASVDSFDKTLLQLYAGHLTSNLITDHIIEHQYDALTSSREKKLFVSKLISHQLATMSMELKRKMFNEVFATMPVDVAKKLAKHVEISSETSSIHADEMFNGEVYGEIEFSSFANIMQRCVELFRSSGHLTPNRKLVFVDLGHGTGKSLIALKFLFGDKFSRAHGIEYAQGLFNESVNRINMSIDIVDNNPIYSSVMRTPHENESFSTCQLCVEEGDFLAVPNDHASPISDHYDWTLADLAFANSTCFGPSMITRLGQMAKKMKVGSIFVTFTYPLPCASGTNEETKTFEIVDRRNYSMSWGLATVFIHRRL